MTTAFKPGDRIRVRYGHISDTRYLAVDGTVIEPTTEWVEWFGSMDNHIVLVTDDGEQRGAHTKHPSVSIERLD